MSDVEDPKREKLLDEVTWDIARSIRYHMRRENFFDLLHRWNNGLSIIFGSAAFIAILDVFPVWVGLASVAGVTIINTLDLVFGFSTNARLHSDLRKRFIKLERAISLEDSPDMVFLRNIKSKILKIETDEPPVKRCLDTICHNDICHAFGYEERIEIPWFHRMTAQIINRDCTNYKRVNCSSSDN